MRNKKPALVGSPAASVENQSLWWEITPGPAGVGFLQWNARWGRLQLTTSCKALFGLEPDAHSSYEFILEIIHPDDREAFDSALRSALRSGGECEVEFRVIWPDDTERWLLARGRTTAVPGIRTERYVNCIVVDLTAFKEAEINNRAQIEKEHAEQLRLLASELSHAEQRERVRLAQMLHDHLQQLLVAARFQVRHLGRIPSLNGDSHRHFRAAEELLMEAIQACRSFALELSPLVLDQGLRPALEWLALWMREKHGLVVQLNVEGECEPTDKDIQLLLFQSAQELLFNVVKHAHVKKAFVSVECGTNKSLKLTVSDRGAGFDPAVAQFEPTSNHGFGLLSIRQRLELLGGRMTVLSEPGMGTQIQLTTPAS